MCSFVCPVNHEVYFSLFFERVSIALCFHEAGIAGYVGWEGLESCSLRFMRFEHLLL